MNVNLITENKSDAGIIKLSILQTSYNKEYDSPGNYIYTKVSHFKIQICVKYDIIAVELDIKMMCGQ